MRVAAEVSAWSKDPSSKIGVCIVSTDKQILSTGYNGFPRGIADDERYNDRQTKYDLIIHAEMNAILTAASHGVQVEGAYIFVYGLPMCSSCAKHTIQAGISHVVLDKKFIHNERWNDSWKLTRSLLEEANIDITIL